MKNFKFSNTMKMLALAGTVVILASCSYDPENVEEDTFFVKPSGLSNGIYSSFIKENRLVPVFDAKNGNFSNVITGHFVEKKMAEPYIDKNGELQFNESWVLIPDDELYRFIGIGRESEEAYVRLYVIEDQNGKLQQKEIDFDNIKFGDDIYLDLDDELVLKDPVEYYYKDGKRVKKVR